MRRIAIEDAGVQFVPGRLTGTLPPDALVFTFESLVVEPLRIVATALLANPSHRPVVVVTSAPPMGIYFMGEVPVWTGPPRGAPVPPPPIELTLAPDTGIELRAEIGLHDWGWTGHPKVSVAWLCAYCRAPYPHGIYTVELPERAAKG